MESAAALQLRPSVWHDQFFPLTIPTTLRAHCTILDLLNHKHQDFLGNTALHQAARAQAIIVSDSTRRDKAKKTDCMICMSDDVR